MLIQKAYEQGRILESSDLTDEALFRLLREDEVVRALATRVVENRFYVRAKPARQEIEGKRPEVDDQSQGAEPGRPTQKSPTSDQVQRAHGREDDDWSEQQRNTENHRRSRPGVESPLRPDRDPEISVPRNPARAVDRAELEQNPNIFENMGSDASRMARIHPEELAGLLSIVSPSSPQLRESESPASRSPAQVERMTRSRSAMDFPERPQPTEQANLVPNRPLTLESIGTKPEPFRGIQISHHGAERRTIERTTAAAQRDAGPRFQDAQRPARHSPGELPPQIQPG